MSKPLYKLSTSDGEYLFTIDGYDVSKKTYQEISSEPFFIFRYGNNREDHTITKYDSQVGRSTIPNNTLAKFKARLFLMGE